MDETLTAAEFLFRYMMARYLCKEGTLSPGAPDYLAREIGHGRRVFDDILIFTEAGPHIINDAKAGKMSMDMYVLNTTIMDTLVKMKIMSKFDHTVRLLEVLSEAIQSKCLSIVARKDGACSSMMWRW